MYGYLIHSDDHFTSAHLFRRTNGCQAISGNKRFQSLLTLESVLKSLWLRSAFLLDTRGPKRNRNKKGAGI